MATLSSIITPSNVLTATNTQTVTNKTISGSSNTITNVPMASASGTLPVANGGTGATSLTANNVLLGNGTSALQAVAPGTSGNVLTSNGTTWTSATPSSSSGSLAAIASGTLPNGAPVVLNADGTVSVVAEVATTPSVSNPFYFSASSDGIDNIRSVYNTTNQKIVIAYRVSSGSSRAIVGTVSGSTITFGAETQFFTSGVTDFAITYDSVNNKVVIAYPSSGNYLTAIVGTVSGTSISFGTQVVVNAVSSSNITATYDTTNQKVVISYSASSTGLAIVGTVSGTSISFGTAVTYNAVAVTDSSITYDSSAGRVVIAYRNSANSNFGTAIVGTVSGTSISFGTAVVFESSLTLYTSSCYDTTNNKVVIAYTTSSTGRAIVGTVSGTSISFGTAVVFQASSAFSIATVYNSNTQKIFVAYSISGSSFVKEGTVSGTTISFGSATTFNSPYCDQTSLLYNSVDNKVIFVFKDPILEFGTTKIYIDTATNLSATNYIGLSAGSYTNGQTAIIQIAGSVDDSQTGLTVGQPYYVTKTGTLSLTPDTPNVFAGIATATTKLALISPSSLNALGAAPQNMVLIGKFSAASNVIDITGLNTYNNYFICFENIKVSGTASYIGIQLGTSGTLYTSSYVGQGLTSNGSTITAISNPTTAFTLTGASVSTTARNISGFVQIFGMSNGFSVFNASSSYDGGISAFTSGRLPVPVTKNQIRILASTNITDGTATVYGSY